MHVIVQLKHLECKGRIVGKDTYRIVVYLKPGLQGLHCQAAVLSGDDPVQTCGGKRVAEGRIREIDFFQ